MAGLKSSAESTSKCKITKGV